MCTELQINRSKFSLVLNKYSKKIAFNLEEAIAYLKINQSDTVPDKGVEIANFYNTSSKVKMNKVSNNFSFIYKFLRG